MKASSNCIQNYGKICWKFAKKNRFHGKFCWKFKNRICSSIGPPPQPDLITRSWSYKVWRLNSSLCEILFKNVTNCQALVPSPRSSPLDTNPFPKQSKTLKSKSDWEWGDRSEEPCHVGTCYSFPFLWMMKGKTRYPMTQAVWSRN